MTTVEQESAKYPGFKGIGYPEVFTTIPQQPALKKPGHLPYEKVKEYFENGFTVVEGFFSPEEIQPCLDSYARLVDGLAHKLYDSGRIKNLYKDLNLSDRLIALEKEWPGAVLLLLKTNKLTPEFRDLYQNSKLLDAMEQLIGPEIGASPVWNTRPKTPGHRETDVPWHQDSAYFDDESYQTLIATAWVAFVDATPENGCMQFMKGGQKKGLVVVHECCDNFYLTIKEEELIERLGANPKTDFITCPVKAGGVIFFNNMVPHKSVPNRSDHIRFAMDLRYQSPNRPWGFFDKSKGILLRSPSKPDHVPDWEFYSTQGRYDIIKELVVEKTGQGDKDDEFDTTLTGPHMDRWKIVNHSIHTETYLKGAQKV
ncbi:phytanoyl-CoA dioxygenase domain-containing protein 1 homolog [Ruditapes philippinarum]|uniref:phytanoyl-CoA dioxygenase domain-containing protein 1 homolog n=1 Tax=Ruditapes philippinarum TaxID=129788 RepID=UPI00295A7D9B|nr:phytanoyl-CoA dioxygenase domain-containing protein 1 homolog [Ruditapes philippinarum]